jgi:catechol 2,3-dioxygenase-like lactoylglutathione lyase family enzyme
MDAMAENEWFARPVINVSNVDASIRYYVDKLGFALDWRFGEPISVCEVWRGKVQLILCDHFPEKVGKSMQFIAFDTGSRDAEIAAVDAYRAELERNGAKVKEGKWGYRVLVIDDLDGNQILVPYPNEPGEPPT